MNESVNERTLSLFSWALDATPKELGESQTMVTERHRRDYDFGDITKALLP